MGYVWKGTTPAGEPEPTVPEPTRGHRPWNPELCGTYPGYAQHQRHGIEACRDCRAANNEYNRAITRNPDGTLKLARTPFDASACGTYKGAMRHRRRGLPICRACRDAYNAANRAYKAVYRERAAA